MDFSGPIGEALLHSFFVTVRLHVLVGRPLPGCFGMSAAAGAAATPSAAAALLRTLFLVPYALPVYAGIITWNFMFQQDNGLVNHVLQTNLHVTDHASFWLIGDNASVAMVDRRGLAAPGRSRSSC